MKKRVRKSKKQKNVEIPYYVREISKETHREILTVLVVCAFAAFFYRKIV